MNTDSIIGTLKTKVKQTMNAIRIFNFTKVSRGEEEFFFCIIGLSSYYEIEEFNLLVQHFESASYF